MSKSQALKPGDHVYLIDGSGYIFRAYHALPPLTRKSDGLPIGAVQGFCNMLWKLLKETTAGQRPTHLAVIYDHSATTFRNRIYPQYKATRTEPSVNTRYASTRAPAACATRRASDCSSAALANAG